MILSEMQEEIKRIGRDATGILSKSLLNDQRHRDEIDALCRDIINLSAKLLQQERELEKYGANFEQLFGQEVDVIKKFGIHMDKIFK